MAAAAAESLQSCPTLCDPIGGSSPGCPIPGILQARTPEWVAISFSNAWKWNVKVKLLSHVWPSVTPWTAAFQAPPSMGFSRQEYWSGVPLPSPRREWQDILKVTTYNQITVPSKDLIQIWRRNLKLYRQAKAERIKHHQTSSSTNTKGSSLDRKHRKGI